MVARHYCLLCGTDNVSASPNRAFPSASDINDPGASSVSKQLHVIFILRNLLEVPSTQLKKYLVRYGNPEGWIRLCKPCSVLVDQAKRAQKLLLEATQRFRSTQKAVIDKVKGCKTKRKTSTDGDPVTKEVWTFAQNYEDYGPFTDPFQDGDAIAFARSFDYDSLAPIQASGMIKTNILVKMEPVDHLVEVDEEADIADLLGDPVRRVKRGNNKKRSRRRSSESTGSSKSSRFEEDSASASSSSGGEAERKKIEMRSKKKKVEPMKFERSRTRFICSICNAEFVGPELLKSHRAVIHNLGSRFKCELCGQTFRLEFALRCHLEGNHADHTTTGTMNFDIDELIDDGNNEDSSYAAQPSNSRLEDNPITQEMREKFSLVANKLKVNRRCGDKSKMK